MASRTIFISRWAAPLLAAALAATSFPTNAQVLAGGGGSCGWTEPAGNTAYPETNARYFRLTIPRRDSDGLRLRVSGDYLDSRYFSFQLYGALFNALDVIADHQIVPDAGSQSPFVDRTRIDPSVASGGRYTVFVVFTERPARPAPNTLYAGRGLLPLARNYLFLRAYLADGAVQLPAVRYERADGQALPDETLPGESCADTNAVAADDTAGPVRDDPATSPAVPAAAVLAPRRSRDVPFEVYRGLGPLGSGVVYNQDAGFMSATIEDRDALVLVRFRAPSYPRLRGPVVPDVRYWSLCQNRRRLQTVLACVADRDAAIDASGFFHAVVGDGAGRPRGADRRHGFSYLPNAGLLDDGFLIYRQLLARPDFTGAIVGVPETGTPDAVLGDYSPQATTCPRRIFAARIAAGDRAAEVFAACRAAR